MAQKKTLHMPTWTYSEHQSYRIRQELQHVSLNLRIRIRKDANWWYQSKSAHIISVAFVSLLEQLNVFYARLASSFTDILYSK